MNDEVRRGEGAKSLPPEVQRAFDDLLRVGQEYGPNSPQALVCKRRLMEATERAARMLEASENED
jgi:hypothetical protein